MDFVFIKPIKCLENNHLIQAITVKSVQSEDIGLSKETDLMIFVLNSAIKQINHFDGIIS